MGFMDVSKAKFTCKHFTLNDFFIHYLDGVAYYLVFHTGGRVSEIKCTTINQLQKLYKNETTPRPSPED